MHDAEVTLTEEAHKRIRLGYQCGRCFEVFLTAWPAQCRCCGFPVATIQREFYEREFVGSRVLRTGLTQEELADGEQKLHELLARRT
jgi:ribosomal protein L37E